LTEKKDWLQKALEEGQLQEHFDVEAHLWKDGFRVTKLTPKKEV